MTESGMKQKSYYKKIIVLSLLAGLLAMILYGIGMFSNKRGDSASLEAGLNIAENGGQKETATACNICHGQYGEGNAAIGAPRLAGLGYEYIKKQLEDFARDPLKVGVTLKPLSRDYSRTPRVMPPLEVFTPGTRLSPMMNGIARSLTGAEIKDIAYYYSNMTLESLKDEPEDIDPETYWRGLELAERGKPEFGLPGCNGCHGKQGEGIGEMFPPLMGQTKEYIISQLDSWQNGTRDNDNNALMKSVANLLTDADKADVAAYFDYVTRKIDLQAPE
jgi:cytochrome c553